MSDQLLWFLNRGTGMALVGALTCSVLLGLAASRARAGGQVPAFVTRAVHRNVSLLGIVLLVVHVATAVLDEFVDIRWWHVVVPFGAAYEEFWVALGTLATDLLLAIVVVTAVRERVGPRRWRAVHLTAYAAWALGLVHGVGIGSDSAAPWARWAYVGSAVVVALGVSVRLLSRPAGADQTRTEVMSWR